jgi:hypothetical protein
MGGMDWINLAQDKWRFLVDVIMNHGVSYNAGNILTSWRPLSLSGRTLLHGASYTSCNNLFWFFLRTFYQLHIIFIKRKIQSFPLNENLFLKVREYNKLQKGGFCSDLCPSTFADLLCSSYVREINGPTPWIRWRCWAVNILESYVSASWRSHYQAEPEQNEKKNLNLQLIFWNLKLNECNIT